MVTLSRWQSQGKFHSLKTLPPFDIFTPVVYCNTNSAKEKKAGLP